VITAILFTQAIFAHPGKTDGSGGHRDNNNASGLGSYHYHCGENPAHLHPGGVCPYSTPASTPTPIPTAQSTSAPAPPPTTAPQPTPSPLPVPVEETTADDIRILINDTELQLDQPPIIEGGRTLVPLRAIFEAFGAAVDWDQATQTVTAIKNDITVSLTIGSNVLNRNGENITLDVPAQLIGGRTLVPARAVAESFGATVDWDRDTQRVIITYAETPQPTPDSPITTPTPRSTPRPFHGISYQSSSDNFEFYTAESVKEYISHISNVLESAYTQLSEELGVTFDGKVTVRVFPDYRGFCTAIGRAFSPNVSPNQVFGHFRAAGNDGRDGIYMTPPNSRIMRDPENFYDKILLHEFVHVLAEYITPAYQLQGLNLHWLVEGLADYKSGEITREYAQAAIKAGVRNNAIPSLADLEISSVERFDDMGGYVFGASIIEFIDKTYGFTKVVELYKSPGDYNWVFGFSKSEFERQWKQFLYENYR